MANCYKCNRVPVEEEFTRCPECSIDHQALVAKLNARPKQPKIEKIKEDLVPIKAIKGGIEVTTWYDRQDLINYGIKIPQEYENKEVKIIDGVKYVKAE